MVKRTALALIFCCTVSTSSFAVMTIRLHDSHGTTGGGEFLAEPVAGWEFTPASLSEVAGRFETFCVERYEFATFGATYLAELNTGAVRGHTFIGFDPLDPMTAYLYDEFITRSLAGYDYNPGPGRVASADSLQKVIWGIEGELGPTWTPASGLQTTFYRDALEATTAGADGKITWSGIASVRVLNLYPDYSRYGTWCPKMYAQDVLVKVEVIPAPGAILLGGIGVVLLGWLRRTRAL